MISPLRVKIQSGGTQLLFSLLFRARWSLNWPMCRTGLSAIRYSLENLVSFLLNISRLIDGFSRLLGKWVAWLVLAATVICALNAAVIKYASNTDAFATVMNAMGVGANSFIEIQWYFFSAVFMLAAGYTLLNQEHVKIDVISGRFSKTTQIWIDIFGICCFLFPFVVFVTYLSWPLVVNAYRTHEMSANAGGLVRWPVFALLPTGLVFLGLQGLSELIKRFAFLGGHIPDPTQKPQGKTAEEELAEFLLQKEVAEREAAAVRAAGVKK